MADKEDMLGHRNRMLHSFSERGSSSFEDYQLLEMLLFFVIPRKDVKPIAKELIKKFGSLEGVFQASYTLLKQVDGVGNKTAVFIKVVYDIFKRIIDNRCKNAKCIETLCDAKAFFKELFTYEQRLERFAIVLLDNSNNIIKYKLFSNGNVNKTEINVREIVEYVLNYNAASVIIAHNHPNGDAYPSNEDINFTLNLRDMLSNLGVYLADHIILNNYEEYSMHLDLNYASFFESENH